MLLVIFFFFFNDTATTEIYTLSLHDALPISDVVPLAVQRRRVVDLEEELEQVPVRDLLGIEGDLDSLGVRSVVPVRRVRDVAAGVTHPRRENARSLPDQILHPPETPSGKDRLLDRSVHVPPPPRSTSRRGSLYLSASAHRLSRRARCLHDRQRSTRPRVHARVPRSTSTRSGPGSAAAAFDGNLELVKLLLELGADP